MFVLPLCTFFISMFILFHNSIFCNFQISQNVFLYVFLDEVKALCVSTF